MRTTITRATEAAGALFLFLVCSAPRPPAAAPQDAPSSAPPEAQVSGEAAAVLGRARAAVLGALAEGRTIRGKLQMSVVFGGDSAARRFSGDFRQDREALVLSVAPFADRLAPGGKALPGSRIEVRVDPAGIRWSVFGRPGFEAWNGPFEYPLPEGLEWPTSPLLVPQSWCELAYDVERSRADPHQFFSTAGAPPATDVMGPREEYLVLNSTENALLTAREEGRLQLWVRRSSGLVEWLVVTLRERTADGFSEVTRAILAFDEIAIE